ncbi:MAG: hypothetical protein GX838_02470 [Clostridiaceae bacterium]|nr:hypothetical protein [Clostridiaceae bacterium]
MKKIMILVAAVLVSSLLLVGCMKTPSFDQLVPGGLGNLIGQTDKESPSQTIEPTDIAPEKTDREDPDSGPHNSYEAYLEAKSALIDQMTVAFNQLPEAGMEATFSLFGFSVIDLMMWPAAIIWEDEATAKQMAGVFGVLDMKFERKEGKSILTCTQDGDTAAFVGERMSGADGYVFTASFGGQEKLRSEFVRTSYGFAGQYYHLEDEGKTTRFMIAIEGHDGAVGIEKDTVRPGSLTGKEASDFPLTAPEWYRIQGKRLTGITSEGKAIDTVLP